MFIIFSKCLQYLDVSVLGELVPRLCELIRSGVGLGTKVRFFFLCVCVVYVYVLEDKLLSCS